MLYSCFLKLFRSHTHTHIDTLTQYTPTGNLFPVLSSGTTTRGGYVLELHLHFGTPAAETESSLSVLQFQYGGDSQKGPVVSPLEAQAQAIMQQTKVDYSKNLATWDDQFNVL